MTTATIRSLARPAACALRVACALRAACGMLVACSMLTLAGCGEKSPSTDASGSAPAPAKELNVYMWSEYIDPAIVADFEKSTGMKVRIDVYEDTESMLAKMQLQEGDRLYDVVIASDHAVPVLSSLGLVRPLDRSLIPNAANVDPRFASPSYDPGSERSLPYQWGTLGIIYSKEKLNGRPLSWDLVLGPDPAPTFVLIDSMRDMMGAALKRLGRSVNDTEQTRLDEAGALIAAAKSRSQCVGFEGGVGGKSKVAAGLASCAMVYSGDALKAVAENPSLAYGVPTEGSVIWVDAMTVTKRARNPEGAHAFINAILDPTTGAKLSAFTLYATPNVKAKALLPEATTSNRAIYPDEATMSRLEYIADVGAATSRYDATWTSVKAK